MSATTVTKNCAINIDHSLGRSVGELSACWVYVKNLHGDLVGLEGAAYIFTHEHQLLPMWRVVFYGGQTLERHKKLYDQLAEYLTPYVKRKIREAIKVDLVRERMRGESPAAELSEADALIYGSRLTGLVVDDDDDHQ